MALISIILGLFLDRTFRHLHDLRDMTWFEFYAQAILATMGDDVDVLFGPAYKGIPLVVTTSIALSSSGKAVSFWFNRNEAKDYRDPLIEPNRAIQPVRQARVQP